MFKIAFEAYGAKKVLDILSSMSKTSKTLSGNLTNVKTSIKNFDTLGKSISILPKKLHQFSLQKKIMKDVGGSVGIFGNYVEQLGKSLLDTTGRTNGLSVAFLGFGRATKNAAINGDGFFKSLQKGFSEVYLLLRTGGITLTAIFSELAVIMGTLLWPLLLAIPVIYTFKKVWENNIGGIQTSFTKALGTMKSAWGRFNAGFIKVLRKSLTPVISGLISGLKSMITPFISFFKDLATMFNFIFNNGNDQMRTFIYLSEVLGTTFKWTGKIIGFVLRVILYAIEGIIGVFMIIGKIIYNQLVKPILDTYDAIKAIWEFFNGSSDSENSNKMSNNNKQGTAVGYSSSSTNSNSVTNNNQSITIHTSRSATPEDAQSFGDAMAKTMAG